MGLFPTIIFPSINRKEILHESVLSAVRQTVRGPILLALPGEGHVLPETLDLPGVEVVISSPGLCCQRNAALRRVNCENTVVFFFDDDVELEKRYVEKMLALFEHRKSIVLAGGVNLGRGSPAGTLTREIATERLHSRREREVRLTVSPVRSVAGCMMAVRGSLVGKVWFDERLPLYGYLEDFDFALQCRKLGSVVCCSDCLMVHIETAAGRMGVKRRGYSEVINPLYIYRKKTGAEFHRILGGALKRTLRNTLCSSNPTDRDRLVGNLLGWRDAFRGRVEPQRILEIFD